MADYREMLGWPVGVDGSGPMLCLGCGVGSVEFLAGRGRDVLAVLRAGNLLGPVLALPGQPLRWVFLTASDGRLHAAQAARGAVRSLADGGGMTPVIRSGPSVYQTNHDRMCQLLRVPLGDQTPPNEAGPWRSPEE